MTKVRIDFANERGATFRMSVDVDALAWLGRQAIQNIKGSATCARGAIVVRSLGGLPAVRTPAVLNAAAPLLDACRSLVEQVRAKWPDHEWQDDTSAWGAPMRAALEAIAAADRPAT